MTKIKQVSTFAKIPAFVPFGVLYFTQDTSDLYIGTGASTGAAVIFVSGGGTGTVSSVTFTGDGAVLSSTPSAAVTTTGTLPATLRAQAANTVLAGPASGANASPAFRSLVTADVTATPLTAPAFFYPTPIAGMQPQIAVTQAGSNMDPAAAGSTANTAVGNWSLFYLPFAITITRWRFQIDGVHAGTHFYAGIYNALTQALIFDIGAIDIGTNTGQYGKGALHDPLTNMFDSGRNATNSVTLAAGWYLLGWGADGGTGVVMPKTGGYDALWTETLTVDTTGLPSGLVSRKAHSSTFDITGGHMPLTLGVTNGGVATEPPNLCFLA